MRRIKNIWVLLRMNLKTQKCYPESKKRTFIVLTESVGRGSDENAKALLLKRLLEAELGLLGEFIYEIYRKILMIDRT